jgi:SAM-dependent methyltransferase
MRGGETVLRWLSRPPEAADLDGDYAGNSPERALDLCRRVYPEFDHAVRGKRVLDFGCGAGLQAVAIARLGASEVVGLETNPSTLEQARLNAAAGGVADRARFQDRLSDDLVGRFDIVLSQNSMEHFSDPAAILGAMRRAIGPGGELWITFGPPWFAPYGSHTHFFTKLPWVNLLFSEETVMNVRGLYRHDGARRYEDVESGLNRMTVAKFDRLVASAALSVVYRRDECVKGIALLGRIPVLRELFINHVTCKLRPQV